MPQQTARPVETGVKLKLMIVRDASLSDHRQGNAVIAINGQVFVGMEPVDKGEAEAINEALAEAGFRS